MTYNSFDNGDMLSRNLVERNTQIYDALMGTSFYIMTSYNRFFGSPVNHNHTSWLV